MLVIRRRPAAALTQAQGRALAEVLRWTPEAVSGSLAGDGWAWMPSRDAAAGAGLLDRLADLGMQAGIVSTQDAVDVESLAAYVRVSLTDTDGFLLEGDGEPLRLGKEEAGGITLLGVRWDGTEVRPYTRFAKKPGVVLWGTKGPLGVVWLRDGEQRSGMSAPELASFLDQCVRTHALRLVDDSYRPDDLPAVGARLRKAWERVGGQPEDAKMLAHAVMLRSLERSGRLRTQEMRLPDVNAPVRTYAVVKRQFRLPDLVRLLAWGTAIGAGIGFAAAPTSDVVTTLGIGASLSAMAHGLRSFNQWLRLRTRPVSRVRAMAMGPVHLEGEFKAAMLLVSPMRGLRCIHYVTRHQKKYRVHHRGRVSDTRWRTVSTNVSPLLPFYIEDGTGRVLVDVRAAEWHGMETFVHNIGSDERMIESVVADGVHGAVYGLAQVDTQSPAIEAVKDGLQTQFLTDAAARFDLNRDGVFDSTEQLLARRTLDEQLRTDRANLSMNKDVVVEGTRDEPLIISSRRGIHVHWKTIAAAAGWIAVAFFYMLGTFPYRTEMELLFRALAR